jgi:CheY-like chemotaxis protein
MTKDIHIILVIDDNPADIYLAHEALEQNARGIRVESAANVDEALSFLKRRGEHSEKPRPDLVILDLNMPRESGRTVLAEVKAAGSSTVD